MINIKDTPCIPCNEEETMCAIFGVAIRNRMDQHINIATMLLVVSDIVMQCLISHMLNITY